MANKKQLEKKELPEYHNTYLLLKKYRDVVWSLELSVQKVKNKFRMEMGSSIEDFLESVYIAGVDFADSGIIEHNGFNVFIHLAHLRSYRNGGTGRDRPCRKRSGYR